VGEQNHHHAQQYRNNCQNALDTKPGAYQVKDHHGESGKNEQKYGQENEHLVLEL
jgi:hypothetical protein